MAATPSIGSLAGLPSRTFCVTVKVLPVSRGTVQFTGSGDRMIICSGDFTLVGSGGLLTTGSSSSQGLPWVIGAAFVVCDGGVEATLESPMSVASPFTWGSAVTRTFGTNHFIVDVDGSSSYTPPGPPKLALDDESNYRDWFVYKRGNLVLFSWQSCSSIYRIMCGNRQRAKLRSSRCDLQLSEICNLFAIKKFLQLNWKGVKF